MRGHLSKSLAAASVAALVAVVAAVPALAHSELEKPLFVSTNGTDSGRCQDPASPCATIGYALQRVGKGGQIRVATGTYEIEDVRDLFHMVSGVVNVRGGYRRSDQFQSPGARATNLVGVPQEYRALLGSRGFHIVADRKTLSREMVVETERLLALQDRLQSSELTAAPCVGGQSGGLACSNAELLSHVALSEVSASPAGAMDVWGFVDLNTNREYAIVGYRTGTGVFDISDAENPVEVGFIDGASAGWRDIKVHQYFNDVDDRWNAFAYVTTDNAGNGLFVIDLTNLPHSISRRSYVSDFSAAHNVFASNIDYSTGLSLTGDTPHLVIAGSNNGGGRFRLYSLANPASPAFVSIPNVSPNDYMHDAASMIIRDARKDSQCVNAGDYCDVLFDFNESTIDVWDITNPNSPVRLSRTPYTNTGYTHSGWPSEDGQYLYVHDELDEQGFGLRTTVRVFSLSNLLAPAQVGTWTGPTTAIDHNGFVRGNRYYMSNYSRGLTILDISNPANPVTIGRLDTYPFSDSANFVGAWGAYPYFPSGNIAVSDINSGLYVIGDSTLASAAGTISFTADSFAAVEGNAMSVSLQRSGGSSGAVSVSLALVPATGDGTDLGTVLGDVSWADGDSADKTVTITTTADGAAEGLERLLVNVIAPTNGATLGTRRATSLYISDPGDGAVVGFDTATIGVAERGFGRAILTVRRQGSASGAASVDFAVTGGDATAGNDYQGPANGTLNWADGDANPKLIEFTIVDDGSGENDEFFEVSLSNAVGAGMSTNGVMRVDVFDGAGANQAPNAVAGGSQTVNSGAVVTLGGGASNDPDGDVLDYAWTQTMGPTVTLNDATTSNATFTAPNVSSDTLLRFELQVTDPSGLSDTAIANVTVRAQGNGGGSFGGGGGGGKPGWPLLALLLTAVLWRRFSRTGAV